MSASNIKAFHTTVIKLISVICEAFGETDTDVGLHAAS